MSAPVPQVSVVIGVRDGGEELLRTLDSVTAQGGVSLECLVVDDGSTDATAANVAAIAHRDPRVRLIRQRAAGLTRALINGCAEARADLIARIDCGDEMRTNRLVRQCAVLGERADIGVLGTLALERGPGGRILSRPVERCDEIRDLTREYVSGHAGAMGGITHYSVCFRRELYRRCGGYRAAFGLAQDVDLWSRIGALATIARLEEALTVSRVATDALSTHHHRTQMALREIAAASARRRRQAVGDEDLLLVAQQLSRRAMAHGGQSGAAAYHVACRLAQSGQHERAWPMFALAARREPWNPRHLFRLAQAGARRGASTVSGCFGAACDAPSPPGERRG